MNATEPLTGREVAPVSEPAGEGPIVIDGMSSFVVCHRCGAYYYQLDPCPRCGR